MKILTSVKIKNYLDDLVNAKTMSLDDFHFTIGKMGYEVDKLIVQTSMSNHEAIVRVKDEHNKYYTIGV